MLVELEAHALHLERPGLAHRPPERSRRLGRRNLEVLAGRKFVIRDGALPTGGGVGKLRDDLACERPRLVRNQLVAVAAQLRQETRLGDDDRLGFGVGCCGSHLRCSPSECYD